MKMMLLSSAFVALTTALPATADDLGGVPLGTGSPVPTPGRVSQSALVQAGDETLVFDMGRGVTFRLAQVGIPLGSVDAHFITHLPITSTG